MRGVPQGLRHSGLFVRDSRVCVADFKIREGGGSGVLRASLYIFMYLYLKADGSSFAVVVS